MTYGDWQTHLASALHGGTLNKVRNPGYLAERATDTVLSKIDPVETMRLAPLAQLIHDDLTDYPIPTDFKRIIGLYPQDNPTNLDVPQIRGAEYFSFSRDIKDKIISIEGSEGSKFLRINWKNNQGTVLNTMDSLTANGTWSAVGTATGLKANSLYYLSGSASIEFDVAASGDGIQNTTMTAVDFTDGDELDDIIFPIYFGSVSNLTSVTAIWGNDLTTKYWTGVAQAAQADGTAFRTGWNWVKFPWSTATETGTVNPATIDSFKITIQATGAISNIRVDNIIFSLGRAFDLKYYSRYVWKNSAGTYLSQPSSDSDTCILQGTAQQIYLLESLKAGAQQTEGADSTFDINYANSELQTLYSRYRVDNPSQAKQTIFRYSSGPRFRT